MNHNQSAFQFLQLFLPASSPLEIFSKQKTKNIESFHPIAFTTLHRTCIRIEIFKYRKKEIEKIKTYCVLSLWFQLYPQELELYYHQGHTRTILKCITRHIKQQPKQTRNTWINYKCFSTKLPAELLKTAILAPNKDLQCSIVDRRGAHKLNV